MWYPHLRMDSLKIKSVDKWQLLADWMWMDYFLQLQKPAYFQTKTRKCNKAGARIPGWDSEPLKSSATNQSVGKSVCEVAHAPIFYAYPI